MKRPRWQRFWYGFVWFEVRGAGCQAMIRQLQRAGVPLDELRSRETSATLWLCLADFDAYYRACRAHKVKLRVLQKEGLPFLLRKMRRRKTFAAGAVLFAAALYVLSSVVWRVEVADVDPETQMALLQAARDLGVHRGVWKWQLPEPEEVQFRILQKLPNLMWVGMTVEGTSVRLEAVPKIPAADAAPERPQNVVAGKPGVILHVFANRGTVVVKPGQVVHPGNLVISGLLAGGGKLVPADGQVLAEVWYKTEVSVPLSVQQSALTGNRVTREYLLVGPLAVRVWGWAQPEFHAEYIRENDTDWRLGDWKLPVQWRRQVVYEAEPSAVARTESEAAQQALRIAAQDVSAQMGEDGRIIAQTVLHKEVAHGKLYETILTRTEEDIGVAAPLPTPAPHPPTENSSP